MCVCWRVCWCICVGVCVGTCVNVCRGECMQVQVRVQACICLQVCMCVQVCACVCMYKLLLNPLYTPTLHPHPTPTPPLHPHHSSLKVLTLSNLTRSSPPTRPISPPYTPTAITPPSLQFERVTEAILNEGVYSNLSPDSRQLDQIITSFDYKDKITTNVNLINLILELSCQCLRTSEDLTSYATYVQ